jgi:tetratricopeptide (TPR) repeat protein
MDPERVDLDVFSGQTLPDVRRRIAQACRRSRVAARLALGASILLAAALVWTDLKRLEADRLRENLVNERNLAVSFRETAMTVKEEAFRVAQVNHDAVDFLSRQLVEVAAKSDDAHAKDLAWLEPLLSAMEDREVEAAVRLKLGAALLHENRFDEAHKQLNRALAINNAELGPEARESCEARELLKALDAARKTAIALTAGEREPAASR